MTWGAEIWGPILLQMAGSAASGYFGGKGEGKKETKMQKTQRKLVDQLLESLGGQGPYADLFKTDKETFQKSYVDPAMQKFRDITAPNIQQQYIAHGQQRSTGLDDTLTRAGVDLDQMLNQAMMEFEKQGKDRQMSILGSILGMGSGAANQPTGAQNAMTGVANYMSGQGFTDTIANLFKNYSGGTSNSGTGSAMGKGSTSGYTAGSKGYWQS
jgi:hypothetical protein